MAVLQLKTLKQMKDSPDSAKVDFLVDQLLPVGSVNTIYGKPKCGKSTIARQLAVSVSKGEPFLNRGTQKGHVIYIALSGEELEAGVVEHFTLLDADDESIHSIVGSRIKGGVASLDETLEAMPDAKLVIIDTLFKFLKVPDADRYMDVSDAMEELSEVAAKRRITVLCVHHGKKKTTEELGDSALGSTAITGGAFTNLFMKGELKQTRTIQSSQRYGKSMDLTELVFDEDIRAYSIGQSVKGQQEKRAADTKDTYRSNIISRIASKPSIEQKELLSLVGGNTKGVMATLKTLVEEGAIKRDGAGGQRDPIRYSIVPDVDENWGSGQDVAFASPPAITPVAVVQVAPVEPEAATLEEIEISLSEQIQALSDQIRACKNDPVGKAELMERRASLQANKVVNISAEAA